MAVAVDGIVAEWSAHAPGRALGSRDVRGGAAEGAGAAMALALAGEGRWCVVAPGDRPHALLARTALGAPADAPQPALQTLGGEGGAAVEPLGAVQAIDLVEGGLAVIGAIADADGARGGGRGDEGGAARVLLGRADGELQALSLRLPRLG